jgi:IS1 family transposase
VTNILPFENQVSVIGALAEDVSIRAIERMTGIHRDTIMRLGVRIGEGCQKLLDRIMRDVNSDFIQLDEIWGFIGKKQRRLSENDDPSLGDVWTFIGVDAESKLVPAFRVGKRDASTADAFVRDLAGRLRNRVQVSSDALAAYVAAIERGFHGDVDYGQIVKTFDSTEPLPASRRYSPPPVISVSKTAINGNPNMDRISTSYVESQNLTFRMHCRRLTRLTNAFSKKLENFKAAVALHFGYYNLVKIHGTVKTTPAAAAGVTSRRWTTADLIHEATQVA